MSAAVRDRLSQNLHRHMAAVIEREGISTEDLLRRMIPELDTPSARTTVWRYQEGKHWPTADRLASMAAGLGIDVIDLLDDPDDPCRVALARIKHYCETSAVGDGNFHHHDPLVGPPRPVLGLVEKTIDRLKGDLID